MTRPNRNPNRKPNRNPLLAFWLGVFIISAFLLPPSSFILVSAQTAEPYAWRAATHPPQTAKMQIWRGDTVPLAPDWGASDTNGWTFTAWWSTNNTDWWSKSLAADPAPTLAGDPFLWTPDMDVGAARYTLFIRAANTNGASYRANAQITMLDSPGTDPASLPLPVTAIDFSLVSTLNAPWLLPDATNALAAARAETVTGAQSNQIHDAAAHIVRADNPHGVTAAQIGALTNELDLAALRMYHYGSPDIVESPAEWFVFDGAGTITGFNWVEGRTNVVIPWEIGGVPVTAIGESAFQNLVTYQGHPVVSVIAPQTVTAIGNFAFSDCYLLTSGNIPQAISIGNSAFSSCNALTSVDFPQATSIGAYAFIYCHSLTSVDLPQVTSIGDNAFYGCTSLASVYFDNDAPTIGAGIFANITANQVTNYVTNPQATGWGATFAGMPVVRPPLYADAIYQAGELVATTGHVAHASLADADGYTTQMVMRVGSEITTNRWGPRLMLPDGIVTNGMGGATIGGVVVSNGYILSGVSTPVATSGFGGAQDNRFILRTPSGVNGGALIAGDTPFVQFCDLNFDALADFGFFGSDIYFVNRKTGKLRFGHQGKEDELMVAESGDVSVKNSLTVWQTNTAAEVRSLGGYSIFDSGSNCYWRVMASNGTFYASDTNGVRKFKFTTETP